MCAKIYSGESFYEYCLRGIQLREQGNELFGDLNNGDKCIRKGDKNKTIFEKVGRKCAKGINCGTFIQSWDYEIIEKV